MGATKLDPAVRRPVGAVKAGRSKAPPKADRSPIRRPARSARSQRSRPKTVKRCDEIGHAVRQPSRSEVEGPVQAAKPASEARTRRPDRPERSRPSRSRLSRARAGGGPSGSSADRIEASLLKIAETATAVRDMAEFYAAIHAIVAELMYAENFYIALYDEILEPDQLPVLPRHGRQGSAGSRGLGRAREGRRGRHHGLRPSDRRPAVPDRGALARADRSGRDHRIWGRRRSRGSACPLRSEGRTLGVIAVQSYREDRRHTERDLEVLTFVAQHIASALERTRAIDETRQRNAELALVNEIGQALASQLEFERDRRARRRAPPGDLRRPGPGPVHRALRPGDRRDPVPVLVRRWQADRGRADRSRRRA